MDEPRGESGLWSICTSCEGTGHKNLLAPWGSCLQQPYSPILSCCLGCPVCGGTGVLSGGPDVPSGGA